MLSVTKSRFRTVCDTGQAKNHQPILWLFSADDLLAKLQFVHAHQIRNIVIKGIIKEQLHFPRILIPGFHNLGHHLLKKSSGKGIEEKNSG